MIDLCGDTTEEEGELSYDSILGLANTDSSDADNCEEILEVISEEEGQEEVRAGVCDPTEVRGQVVEGTEAHTAHGSTPLRLRDIATLLTPEALSRRKYEVDLIDLCKDTTEEEGELSYDSILDLADTDSS